MVQMKITGGLDRHKQGSFQKGNAFVHASHRKLLSPYYRSLLTFHLIYWASSAEMAV